MASRVEARPLRLLLDTQVWLWMVAEPSRLRSEVRDVLATQANALFLSTASCWEMAMKYRLGRLPLPETPSQFVPPRLLRDGVAFVNVEVHHALAVAELPDLHSDPFDRMLIAQARAERLVLVSAGADIARYDVALLRA